MGKLLETLQQVGGRRFEAENSPAPAASEVAPVIETAPPEEVPFIEVGGRRAPLEASPSVLASAPPPRTLSQPNAQPGPGPRLQRIDPPAAEVMGVHFRPLGAAPVRPLVRFAPELVAFHQPGHAVSRQYEALADALAEQPPGSRGRVLLTATRPGAGTTTVLLNLAITFARRAAARIIVVDAQCDRPAVAERLAIPSAPGLHEVLTGLADLSQAVQATGQDGLYALTAGHVRGRPTGRWAADGLGTVVRQLRESFDLVLLDAPCWDGRPDAAALAALSDAVYLVAPGADDAATAELVRSLPRQGVPLRGQIVTGR